MRKTAFVLLSFSLLLTSCGGATGAFTLEFKNLDPNDQKALTDATIRVMDKRMLAKDKKLLSSASEVKDGVTTVTVTVSDQEALDGLTQAMTEPFTLEILKHVEAGAGDVHLEFGDFQTVGLSTNSFAWIVAGSQKLGDQEQGFVEIHFTEQGQKNLKKLFTENQNDTIAVFVRGRPVSRKVIEKTDTGEGPVTISGIPSAGLAEAFADDVNVGLHVVLKPQ